MTSAWCLLRRDTGAVVVEDLEIAAGFWSRFVGLQFRASLKPGAGLLRVPCSSIHTFFVRFPLDVVMIDERGTVVGARRAVKPWRVVLAARRTHAILEMPPGGQEIAAGTTLRLARGDGTASAPPAAVAFLAEV